LVAAAAAVPNINDQMKVVDWILIVILFILQVDVVKSKFLLFEWLVASCLNRALGLG
jgi:hypothetical protein